MGKRACFVTMGMLESHPVSSHLVYSSRVADFSVYWVCAIRFFFCRRVGVGKSSQQFSSFNFFSVWISSSEKRRSILVHMVSCSVAVTVMCHLPRSTVLRCGSILRMPVVSCSSSNSDFPEGSSCVSEIEFP